MCFTVYVLYLTAIASKIMQQEIQAFLNGLFKDAVNWEDYILSVKLMWQRISVLKRVIIA